MNTDISPSGLPTPKPPEAALLPKAIGVFREAEPCKHCGDTRRYIKGGVCPTCKIVKQRAYRAKRAMQCENSHRARKAASNRVAAPSHEKAATGPHIGLFSMFRHGVSRRLLCNLKSLFELPLKLIRISAYKLVSH